MASKLPSSSTAGFFQNAPRVENQWVEDEALRRVASSYLPHSTLNSISPSLDSFASTVLSPTVLAHVADAEKNPPYLQTWDTWGRRSDVLITSSGWRELQAIGIREGIVAIGYENQYAQASRVVQFLKYHVWSASSAIVTCPSAMTDGAARLLSLQIQRIEGNAADAAKDKVLREAYKRLISRDPERAWTSGQWMTERTGGSDVRNTETLARVALLKAGESKNDAHGNLLGQWHINGFKWFSSATDANMAVLLAQTSKGLSLFYAPMRRVTSPAVRAVNGGRDTELNGVEIQRLKSKLGTKALPTAELVLQNTRAWLLGEEGKGTKEISPVLNITRVHNAVSAVGFWGRGLAVSRAFARVRRSGGKLLKDTPAHTATMAKNHVKYRANMHLAFFTVALLGISENGTSDSCTEARALEHVTLPKSETSEILLRLLTPITKAMTAKAAIKGLQECMESLGGVGYLEHDDMSTNIARLYRDANVLSIWEGTTDVLADDLVRVLKGRTGAAVLKTLTTWISTIIECWDGEWTAASTIIDRKLLNLVKHVHSKDKEVLLHEGRNFMKGVAWIICSILLIQDARSDGDAASAEIARRWTGLVTQQDWEESVLWDRRIVFYGYEKDKAKL